MIATTSPSYSQNATGGSARSEIPWSMLECENRGHCGAWLFDGANGEMGQTFDLRGRSHLHVEQFDDTHVFINRADENGLTATYTGKRDGTHIYGRVIWDWPGHFHGGGPWNADIEDVTPEEALRLAGKALSEGNIVQAHRWYYEAARRGSALGLRLLLENEQRYGLISPHK